MNGPVTVVLLGEPVAFARTRWGKQGVPITPPKQRAYQKKAAGLAAVEMVGRLPFDCPVRVDLEAQFAIPKSWPKAKKADAAIGVIRPSTKPDLDNIVKMVGDSFNQIVYTDDALIVEYGTLRKIYSGQPKIVVTVSPVDTGAAA